MKKIFFLILLLSIFNCVTKNTIVEETTTSTTTTTTTTTIIIFKKVFKYDVPEEMQESPVEAQYYKYDNLLVDKNTNIFDSTILIAVRHAENKNSESLKEFVEKDQMLLRSSITLNYFDVWEPPSLKEKNIEYISYQFSYQYKTSNIFQRSIYLKCEDLFYIISLSSKNKKFVLDSKNDIFWQSIRIEEIAITKGEEDGK